MGGLVRLLTQMNGVERFYLPAHFTHCQRAFGGVHRMHRRGVKQGDAAIALGLLHPG